MRENQESYLVITHFFSTTDCLSGSDPLLVLENSNKRKKQKTLTSLKYWLIVSVPDTNPDFVFLCLIVNQTVWGEVLSQTQRDILIDITRYTIYKSQLISAAQLLSNLVATCVGCKVHFACSCTINFVSFIILWAMSKVQVYIS